MKCQILFSGKNKKNISKCCLLKILPRVLSVNIFKYLDGQVQANRANLYWVLQNVAFVQNLHCLPVIQQYLDT